MKKTRLTLTAMLFLCTALSSCVAQSTSTTTKQTTTTTSTTSSSSANSLLSSLGNIVAGLLGTDKVNENSIIGTWTYEQPAVVFESQDLLTNVGAMAASSTVEKKVQTYLDKIGFTKGKVTITFNEDNTGSVICASKNIPCSI